MKIAVFIGAVIGVFFLLVGLLFTKGAPQEAAMAAMACAFAVIPYVVYRVIQLESARKEENAFREAVLNRLGKQVD